MHNYSIILPGYSVIYSYWMGIYLNDYVFWASDINQMLKLEYNHGNVYSDIFVHE